MERSILACGRFRIDLQLPKIMGILNVTPDSFSDGGRFFEPSAALTAAEGMLADGAHIVDIGAESTRPGALPLPLDEEWARLQPVLRGLRDFALPVSIDTYKPEIMRRACEEGASMINDVWGLRQPGATEMIAGLDCAVCIMHMQGDPQTMQLHPSYGDVVQEVGAFLEQRMSALEAAGVARERMVVDPGFGFGKTLEQNFQLLAGMASLVASGRPVLAGLSRKGSLGAVTGKPVGERMVASVAAALLAVERGARIVRVHDVGATADALKVWEMMDNPSRVDR